MIIQPQRLTQLLSSDVNFIVQFIVGRSDSQVADRLAAMGFDRPMNADATGKLLQDLLDGAQDNAFVQALSVNLNDEGLKADQVVAVYQAVGLGTTPNTVAKALAQNALRLFKAEPTPPETAAPTDTPMTTTPTLTPEQQRKRLIQLVLIGLLAIGTIIGIAVLVRLYRK
jgi:hypothetical protein